MIMVINDGKDNDNCHISVSVKLDLDLLIPFLQFFPSRFQVSCIRRKLPQTMFDLVRKSDELL